MKFVRLHACSGSQALIDQSNIRLHSSSGRWNGLIMCLLFAVAYIMCPTANAQTSSGIRGRVTDSTGAVIPKAKVLVHNEKTGVDKTTVSTGSGDYSVPFLDPGIYDVRVEAERFQSVNKTSLSLATDQTLAVNFLLQPGNVTQTVSVNASSVVLDYDKPDRGDIVDNKRIQELPVNTGNTFNLADLSAGISTGSSYIAQAYNNQSAQSLSIHGAAVEFNLDGVTDLSMTGGQNYAYAPPTAAVQEFKITTNAFDAAAGRSPGGAIDMTLKTGTKQLHGTAYEQLQRAFLNANTSSNNANIALHGPSSIYNKPASSQDQYGAELDGPVIIPKIWSSRRQTFFTLLYETVHQRGIGTATASVPLPAMLNGDFSSLLTAKGATYNQPIYDPLSEAACTANNTDNGTYASGHPHVCRYQFGYGPGAAPGPQGGPVLTGTPNVIPTSRLNPVATSILSWYPAPNLAPTPSTSNDFGTNFIGTTPGISLNRTYLIKLDQNHGEKDSYNLTLKLWTQFGTANGAFPRNNVNSVHPGPNFAAATAHFLSHYKDPSVTVGWIHAFSPNLVNSAKASVLITDQTDSTGPANGFNPANLGFPASLAASNPTYFNRFPLTNLSNYNALGSITGLDRGDNELQVGDEVNYTRGQHNMHFGVDLRPTQYGQRSSNGSGSALNLSIGKAWTQQWDTVVTGGATNLSTAAGYSGNAIASLLVGTADSGNATAPPSVYYSSHYYAAYFQDDWKVRPNLTLNLGLRWETLGDGDVERHNRQVYDFNTTDVNPITNLINFSGLPINQLLGGITFAGVGGNPRGPFSTVLDQFGPRLGFAFTANPRTVLRGGIGLYYGDQGNGNAYAPAQNGYTSTTNYVGSNDGGATPLQNLADPFPVIQPVTGNCNGNKTACLVTNVGQSLSFINPNFRPPLVLMSALSVEQQFTKWDTLELAYAGNRTYNPTYSYDLNHISAAAQAACDPERGGKGTNCTSGAATGTGGYIRNPFKGVAAFAGTSYYTAPTIQRYNFSRPFPQFTSITESNLNGGEYYYNALEATYNHRTSVGLTLHATYTFSKAISASGYADMINNIPSRTISGTDVPHRITISDVYLLPFQRGRGIFPNMNRYLDLLVGGWQVSSIFTYQSGLPFSISGYEINPSANGGYLVHRQRYYPGQTNPYYSGKYTSPNSYVQAFKPCVGTRDPNTGSVTLQAYSVAAGCTAANFVSIISTFGETRNVEYTGIRLQRTVDVDANISKSFKIHDKMSFQLRMDAFNALNHTVQLSSGYDTSSGDSNFGTFQMGTASSGNYPPRVLQLTGRLTF